jgi:hypothetical protein
LLKNLKKLKNMLWSENNDLETSSSTADPSSDIDKKFATRLVNFIDIAKSAKDVESDDTGLTLEETWDDEYKIYKGGGLQWSTSMAYRSKKARKIRPNSEDNFIFNMLQIQVANITAQMPEIRIDGVKKKYADKAEKLTHLVKFNDRRNNFDEQWDDWVTEFSGYGPLVVEVCFDAEWTGGVGPDRWIGDVRLKQIAKEDFLPDPAILDLERNINDCSMIATRDRWKVLAAQKRFPDFKKYLSAENNENEMEHEGSDPEMLYVYKVYHRGFPEYMPADRAKELRERAAKEESEGDHYKTQDLYDMANGNVEGVHLAYVANNTVLEYIPYAYDHGNYPIEFCTRYRDEKSQWGWGEIRNTKIPQLMHNKADEIEIEAMAKEGLGGCYYQDGAVNPKQLEQIIQNSGVGGMWFAVDNVNLIKDRTGVKVPASIVNYKEHKQRVIENVSSVTPIQQGMAPGGNMPFKAIAELGARTDIRIKKASTKLSNFLSRLAKQRILLFAQYYTEERYYRYEDATGEIQEGKFSNNEIFDVWDRETRETQGVDEMGQPTMQQESRQEKFIPDFDITCTVVSSKPNDRQYYTQLATDLHAKQLLDAEDLFYTLDEGKLPPTENIIKKLMAKDMLQSITSQMGQLPQELQQQLMQQVQQQIQQMSAQFQQEQQGQQQQQHYQGMQQEVIDSHTKNQMKAQMEGGMQNANQEEAY